MRLQTFCVLLCYGYSCGDSLEIKGELSYERSRRQASQNQLTTLYALTLLPFSAPLYYKGTGDGSYVRDCLGGLRFSRETTRIVTNILNNDLSKNTQLTTEMSSAFSTFCSNSSCIDVFAEYVRTNISNIIANEPSPINQIDNNIEIANFGISSIRDLYCKTYNDLASGTCIERILGNVDVFDRSTNAEPCQENNCTLECKQIAEESALILGCCYNEYLRKLECFQEAIGHPQKQLNIYEICGRSDLVCPGLSNKTEGANNSSSARIMLPVFIQAAAILLIFVFV